MMKLKIFLIGILFPAAVFAQKVPSLDALLDGIHHWNLLHPDRTYARYAEKDYEKIADNLIAYQNEDGGWLKNMDWAGVLNIDSIKAGLKDEQKRSTLDNRNTFSQIEYLADVYTLTKIQSRFGKRPAISALHTKEQWRLERLGCRCCYL